MKLKSYDVIRVNESNVYYVYSTSEDDNDGFEYFKCERVYGVAVANPTCPPGYFIGDGDHVGYFSYCPSNGSITKLGGTDEYPIEIDFLDAIIEQVIGTPLTIDDYKNALNLLGITDDAIKDLKKYGYLEDLFNSAINAGGFMIGETIGFTDDDGVAGVGTSDGEEVTVLQLRSTLVIDSISCEFVKTSVLTSDYDVIPVDVLIKTLDATDFYERLDRRNMGDDGDE